jgi:hypothetical protein
MEQMITFDWRSGKFVGLTDVMMTRLQRQYPTLKVEMEIIRCTMWLYQYEDRLMRYDRDWWAFVHAFLAKGQRAEARLARERRERQAVVAKLIGPDSAHQQDNRDVR